jgi:peptide/nickel transport system substrate-binding protein
MGHEAENMRATRGTVTWRLAEWMTRLQPGGPGCSVEPIQDATPLVCRSRPAMLRALSPSTGKECLMASCRLPALIRGLLLIVLLGAGFVPLVALAQDATPATSQSMRSRTRAEIEAAILAEFPIEEPRNHGGQVIYGVPSDLTTLNGLLTADLYSAAVTDRIYEPLVDISPVDGQPMPILADWWELAPDGVTYTFHLNPNATWHDGSVVTAEDVVFTFDAALEPDTGYIGQADLAAVVDSYRAIDDHTFEITSNGVIATFLWDIRYVVAMPKHLWADVPFAEWASDPGSTGEDPSRVVGTGPFTLVEWVQGDHATLARNDDYYGAVPVIDEFIVSVQPDGAASVEALKAGDIDLMDLVPMARLAELEAIDSLALERIPTTGMVYYRPNLDPEKTVLFQDQAVREALFLALDREALVEAVWLGNAVVARGTQPPLSPAYAPDLVSPAYEHDPERAQELLAGAGWTDSNGDGTVDKDGQEFAFEMIYEEGWPSGEQIAPYLQEAWRAIGVAVTPRPLPFPTLFEATIVNHDFEMSLNAFYWEPSGSQGLVFRCDSYEAGFNPMKYCNPTYDELDHQQYRELDSGKRRDMLIEQSNIVWQDLPLGLLAYFDNHVGYNTRLRNLYPTGWGESLWSLPWVWVAE